MNAYSLALFLHVVGALGLFVALGLEWNALSGLRSATTAEEARRALAPFRTLRVLGPAALVTILVAGLFMTATVVGWQAWNAIGLAGLVVIFVLGAASNATRLPRIGRAVGPRQGALSLELRAELADPVLWWSMLARAGIALGIVFLMTTKPDAAGSAVAIATSAAIGVVVAWLSSRARRVPSGDRRGLERAS